MRREQEQVARFTEYIGADEITQWDKFREEVGEALLETDPKKVGIELTDVVIVAFGLLHCLGLDFETLFDEKMKLNWEKYASMPDLKASGHTHDEAVLRVKEQWLEKG